MNRTKIVKIAAIAALMLIGAAKFAGASPASSPATTQNSSSPSAASTSNAASSSNASAPTTRPITLDGQSQREYWPDPVPAAFDDVGQRNLFIKGPQTIHLSSDDPNASQHQREQQALTVQSQYMLTGVAMTESGVVAFLENQNDLGNVIRVSVGDAIAEGKVLAIDLEGLDYQGVSGHRVHVDVGKNLTGGEAWGVSNTSTPTPQATGGMSDVLARLRARRLKELNGG